MRKLAMLTAVLIAGAVLGSSQSDRKKQEKKGEHAPAANAKEKGKKKVGDRPLTSVSGDPHVREKKNDKPPSDASKSGEKQQK